jgi:hypothetical protein
VHGLLCMAGVVWGVSRGRLGDSYHHMRHMKRSHLRASPGLDAPIWVSQNRSASAERGIYGGRLGRGSRRRVDGGDH